MRANGFNGVALLTVLLFLSPGPLPKIANAASGETVKVELISNLVVMPGYVNESPKLDVVLDTGASDSLLTPEWAAKLKLGSTASATAAGIGKGEDETLHLSSGVHLAWGPEKKLKLDDQQIGALPITYISEQTGYPVDGIFGSSLFQHFQIRVDYERAEVTFNHGSAAPAKGTAIPLKIYGGIAFVEAALETAAGEKVPALFLVDSGTTGTMILSRKFLDQHPAVAAGHQFVDVPQVKAVGGAIDLQLLRITGFDLGPFRFAAPVAAVPRATTGVLADGNVAGFIGAAMLSRFSVDWDYEHNIMTLAPNGRYAEPFEADASGLKLTAEKPDWKTVRVAAVSRGGPGAEAGLVVGDVVQSIDGRTPPPLYELTKLLARPGTSVTITVMRSGQVKSATVHLRRLV